MGTHAVGNGIRGACLRSGISHASVSPAVDGVVIFGNVLGANCAQELLVVANTRSGQVDVGCPNGAAASIDGVYQGDRQSAPHKIH